MILEVIREACVFPDSLFSFTVSMKIQKKKATMSGVYKLPEYMVFNI